MNFAASLAVFAVLNVTAPLASPEAVSSIASDTLPLAAMALRGSQDAAWFITGVKQGMRHHQCSLPEVFFEGRCQ